MANPNVLAIGFATNVVVPVCPKMSNGNGFGIQGIDHVLVWMLERPSMTAHADNDVSLIAHVIQPRSCPGRFCKGSVPGSVMWYLKHAHVPRQGMNRSEEHTSELQSRFGIS